VRLHPTVVSSTGPGEIERIEISAGVSFRLELREGDPRSEIVMTETQGTRRKVSVVPMRTLTESELMAGELEILQRDAQYESSLNALAAVAAGARGA